MKTNLDKIIILIVEDDTADVLSTKSEFEKLLDPNAFIFHVASNGIEALDKLYGINSEQKISPAPNVILVDIRMPKMDGISFLKELRNNPDFDNALVYILTCMYGTDDKIAVQNLKIAGKIVKPMQYNDVLSVYMNIISPKLPS